MISSPCISDSTCAEAAIPDEDRPAHRGGCPSLPPPGSVCAGGGVVWKCWRLDGLAPIGVLPISPTTYGYPITAQPTSGSTAPLDELLLHNEDLTGLLHEFTATIAGRLSGDREPVWCAITLLRDKKPATVTSSSTEADALDEVQNLFQNGPCLTAIREHHPVRVGDVRTDPRWADYLTIAATQGVRSVLGVPFELAGKPRPG